MERRPASALSHNPPSKSGTDMSFPSIDLAIMSTDDARAELGMADEYPIHDREGLLEFVLGMWFNTRELAGKPTLDEVRSTLIARFGWPHQRVEQLMPTLRRNGQVAP